MAVFTLKKDVILKNPQKEILDGSYLEGASSYFLNDNNLQNSISALVYNVPVEKASQVTILRDIELALREEGGLSISESAKHSHFLEILEEVIQNSELDLSKAIVVLSRLDVLIIKSKNAKERIKIIWDELTAKQIHAQFEKQQYAEEYCHLLVNATTEKKVLLLGYLTKNLRNIKEFTGRAYYKALNSIENCIKANSLNININDYIESKVVRPDIFWDYLTVAGSDYLKYKLSTDAKKLNDFIAEKIPNELPEEPLLEILSNDKMYTFEKLRESIEKTITENQVTPENINTILTNYKTISKEKPLSEMLTDQQINTLLQSVTDDCEGYFDLLAMGLVLRETYDYNLHHPDNTISVLQQTDDKIVERLVPLMEYYLSYGDLLLLVKDWPQPLLIAVVKELTLNPLDNISKISVTDILPHFEEIKDLLNVSEKSFLKRLDGWSKSAIQDIDEKNIEEIIPDTSFFYHSIAYDFKLTKHINKIAKNLIDSYSKDDILEAWGDDNSYLFNVLSIFVSKGTIRNLPQNIFSACKDIFNKIADREISIPNSDTKWHLILAKAHKKELAPRIKNIRDGFFRNGDISSDLFLFFAGLFELYGEFEDKAGDATRIILTEVILYEDCLLHILKNTEFYSKVINAAGDDAEDLKEIIQNKILEEPSNKFLETFAQKIGLK